MLSITNFKSLSCEPLTVTDVSSLFDEKIGHHDNIEHILMCAIVCASKAMGNSPYEKVKILCKMPTKLF